MRERDCPPASRDDLRCGFAFPSPQNAAKQSTGDGTLDERLYCLMDYYNPTSLIDTNGDVQERYAYSAFGLRRIMAADFTERASSSYDWDFAFKGQFLDTETGYYDYGYRYYSPQLGRWLNRDPIGEEGGVNLYVFVGNLPTGKMDFLGNFPADPPMPDSRGVVDAIFCSATVSWECICSSDTSIKYSDHEYFTAYGY